MTIPFSAGALYSTTEDLLRWEQALFGGKLLAAASLKRMTTAFKNDYAFGLGVKMVNGHPRIQHGGAIDGFSTQMAYYPDDRLVVIVLGNLYKSAPSEIALLLASVVHGEKVVLPSERKEIAVPVESLRRYMGRYELNPSISIVIALAGDHLTAQPTDQDAVVMYPEAEGDFFWKESDAQVEFTKNDKGEITAFTLHQLGHPTTWVRK